MSNFANVNTPADAGSKRSALYREHDKENLAPCVTLEKKSPNPKPKKKANISSSILSPPTDDDYDGVIVISLDGNIGAGKSTLLKAVAEALPEVEVVVEPVAEWETLKTDDGKSLLQHFYEDKARWSYTFQNCAILTRLVAIQNAIKTTKKKVIITERSLLTDRFVFAEMLNDSGDLNAMEWALYRKWFDNFAVNLPIKAVIHVTTSVDTSASRIICRNREGESGIPTEYLDALDKQHYKWLDNTDMPVLRLSTDVGIDVMDNIDKIRQFVHGPHVLNDAAPIKEASDAIKMAPSPFTMNKQVVPVETL